MHTPQNWDKFIDNCDAISNTADLMEFFNLVLTPAEREKIAARYMILAELIHGGKTQREIAAAHQVSIFNVTRGANQLKRIAPASKQLIHKLP